MEIEVLLCFLGPFLGKDGGAYWEATCWRERNRWNPGHWFRSLISISEGFYLSTSEYSSLHFTKGERTLLRDRMWSCDRKGCVLLIRCKPHFFKVLIVPGTHSNGGVSFLNASKVAFGFESSFCVVCSLGVTGKEFLFVFDGLTRIYIKCLFLPYYLFLRPFLSPGALSFCPHSLPVSTPLKKTAPHLPVIIGSH